MQITKGYFNLNLVYDNLNFNKDVLKYYEYYNDMLKYVHYVCIRNLLMKSNFYVVDWRRIPSSGTLCVYLAKDN